MQKSSRRVFKLKNIGEFFLSQQSPSLRRPARLLSKSWVSLCPEVVLSEIVAISLQTNQSRL